MVKNRDYMNNSKLRLMLVEDHELTRVGLKVVLEKNDDIEIIAETSSGKEAISLYKEKKPDLILMDIGLLEMDGIEATQKIKAENKNVGIIMLTSHESEKEILASLTSGADGYCLKETSPDQLYNAIKSVAEGNAWLSSQVAEKVLRNIFGKDINLVNKRQSEGNKTHIPTIPLSERELEVLKLIVDGNSNQEIAEKLFVTLATVKTHVRSILNKLSVNDRTQAAVKAMREGLVTL